VTDTETTRRQSDTPTASNAEKCDAATGSAVESFRKKNIRTASEAEAQVQTMKREKKLLRVKNSIDAMITDHMITDQHNRVLALVLCRGRRLHKLERRESVNTAIIAC